MDVLRFEPEIRLVAFVAVFLLLAAGEASGAETSTNFGFTFPWWDHLCGTYRAQPAAGHRAMTVGLTCFRDPQYLRLDKTLLQPLFHGDGPKALGDRHAA